MALTSVHQRSTNQLEAVKERKFYVESWTLYPTGLAIIERSYGSAEEQEVESSHYSPLSFLDPFASHDRVDLLSSIRKTLKTASGPFLALPLARDAFDSLAFKQ
ncbi:hypothetical protein JOM56_004591 [Amanita muscaria]